MLTIFLLPKDDIPIALKALSDVPVMVGRGLRNDVVINDETVSWHHACFWLEDGAAWLRDMGSTNGTFLNDQRLRGAERLRSGDRVRLGTGVHVEVRGDDPDWVAGPRRSIEDLATSTRFPIRGDRFRFGAGAAADLVVDAQAVVLAHANGEVWLGVDDVEREIAIGEEFTVGGRKFAVRSLADAYVATEPDRVSRTHYPYRLTVMLDGATGPSAVVTEPEVLEYRIDGSNRVVLLYMLARQLRADRLLDKPEERLGWIAEEDLLRAIWGRSGDDNKLNVLLYRLRADLRIAGFDPWCIEKRRRFLRLRDIELELP